MTQGFMLGIAFTLAVETLIFIAAMMISGAP